MMIPFRRAILVAMVALAVMLSGYAHHASAHHNATNAQALAAGFLLSDICGMGGAEEAQAVAQCLACMPTAQGVLSTPCAIPVGKLATRPVPISLPQDPVIVGFALLCAHGPRAPPLA